MSSSTASSEKREGRRLRPPQRSIAIWGPLLGVTLIALLIVWVVWRHIQVNREIAATERIQSQITVDVITVKRDHKPHDLLLPGNIQAYQEATLFARTNGYIKAWYTDIGTKVTQGQLIAEIEAPDIDAQLRQTVANLAQARANLQIADLTFKREQDLLQKKVVSDQEFDQSRSSYEAAEAAVKSGEANVQNLQAQQGFQKITAPFDGVITQRDIDVGALVSLGSGSAGTKLFDVEQTNPLRIYTYVPQTNALDIHDGMKAKIEVEEYPGRDFDATVARTAGAIDPTSRTLLTEVDIPNPDGVLYAGMYAQVKFTLEEKSPPIVVAANALAFRTDGPVVAVVKDNKVHLQYVKIGRDLGATLELVSGVEEGATVVVNPSDDLQDGTQVQVKQPDQSKGQQGQQAPQGNPSASPEQSKDQQSGGGGQGKGGQTPDSNGPDKAKDTKLGTGS